MIRFITLTPAGYVLDSAGNAPELHVNPGAIAAIMQNGSVTTLTLSGGTFQVKESIEQIEVLILQAIGRLGHGAEVPGECRHCGCTEDDACITKDGPCHWVNAERTVCSVCANMPITEARL